MCVPRKGDPFPPGSYMGPEDAALSHPQRGMAGCSLDGAGATWAITEKEMNIRLVYPRDFGVISTATKPVSEPTWEGSVTLTPGVEKLWLREANEEVAQDHPAVSGPEAGLRGSRIHPGNQDALLAVGRTDHRHLHVSLELTLLGWLVN